MSSFGLLRVPKCENFPIKQEKRNEIAVVKQEPFIHHIKKEPMTKSDSHSSFINRDQMFMTKKQEFLTVLTSCSSNKEPGIARKVSPANPAAGFSKNKRKLTTGSMRRREFLKAVHIHKVLTAKDPNSLSNRELDSLTWAESVVVRDTFRRTKNATKADSNHSLTRPGGENGEEIVQKRASSPEVLQNPLWQSSESIADTLQLSVVDFGKAGGRYTFENGRLIEKALGEAVVNYVLQNLGQTAPTYGRSSWHDGVIVLDCKDQLSYDFAKLVVPEMKLWRRSVLRAVPPEKIPFSSKGRLYVPDLGIGKDQVLNVLRSQNPTVNMRKWKVFEEEDSRDGFKGYTLLMAEPPPTLLQSKLIRLFFGAGEVSLQLLGCNWPDEV